MRIAGSHITDTRSGAAATATATLVKMLIPLWLHSLTAAFVIGFRTSLAAEVFPLGATHLYHMQATTLLNELDGGGSGRSDVGFRLTNNVAITALWTNGADARLLHVHATTWRLHVRGQNVADFKEYPSRLEEIATRPFYILWSGGKINKILLPKADFDLDAKALKKGIASLFQFQLNSQETHEVDVSGNCHAVYRTTDPAQSFITKEKHCEAMQHRQEGLLSSGVDSTIRTVYTLTPERGDYVKIAKIENAEDRMLSLPSYNAVGAQVALKQVLTLVNTEEGKVSKIEAATMEAAEQILLQKEDLTIDTLNQIDYSTEKGEIEFTKQLKTHRPALSGNKLVAKAKSAVLLLTAAKKASKDEIIKVLKNTQNNRIKSELLDIFGFAQSTASHAAVSKILHIDNASQSDLNERYLWALSFSANPNPEIMEDLLKKFKNTQNIPVKVSETLISTLASMARNLRAQPNYDQKIHNDIQSIIVNYMDASKAAGKKAAYLRALINLQSSSTMPLLLEIISGKKGYTPKEVSLAWRAILLITQRDLVQRINDANVAATLAVLRNKATRTFLQIRTKEDSCSRTAAFDILLILASLPDSDVEQLVDVIVGYLRGGDADSEVNQYILQKLKMLFEDSSNQRLAIALDRTLKESATLSNYHIFSPKGLSVVMSAELYAQNRLNKSVDEDDFLRGGLSTVQEIQKGFVKRGVVSVRIGRGKKDMELFGLGLFSSGLGGLMGGGDDAEVEGDAMAGMELSVLGTHLRPFVFFTGQGELMGHVWSGTGSERTPAFQALMILHDHQQHIRLGSGLAVAVDVKSAASIDLAGQITISLWYRNADAKVEKAAGIFTLGTMSVDTSFASSRIEFSVSLEPRLELNANVDFSSSDVSLCMRLSQPPFEYAHNVYKIERVDGSKHKLRRRVRRRHPLPGKTYALNKKNADMCNAIFSN